jgi:N-acetylmuramoyl-L-alanine amidase
MMKTLTLIALSFLFYSPLSAQTKICIDPGHGGSDPGAQSNGLAEADITLDIALKFQQWLEADSADSSGGGNWSVYMTRTTDTYVSLSSRTSYANSIGVARFVSIHVNSFSSSSANGTETYCYTSGSSNSFAMRDKIQEEMINAWGLTNRGSKTANFYVLRYTNMPATLSETGFITNSGDAIFLGSDSERDTMALHHLYALQRHYGLTAYEPSGGTTQLFDGVTISSLSDSTGGERHFYIDVPSGKSNLTFTMSGGSGDADLYINYGSPASTTDWDYRPYLYGNNETVNVSSPTGGRWYVMIRGYSSYSGVSLNANY